jgi:hypothetical protein
MRRSASALAFASLLAAAHARADAIGPPPENCAEGSTAEFCHGPETCRAAACTTDGDCGAGQLCRALALCTRDHCCSGICCADGCGGTPPPMVKHVEGPCIDGRCDAFGTTCETLMVCIDGAGIDAGGTDRLDAGRVDAGRVDAGRVDAGSARVDAGRAADAGGTVVTYGGCCSVAGRRGESGAILVSVIAVAWLAARRLRKPRG